MHTVSGSMASLFPDDLPKCPWETDNSVNHPREFLSFALFLALMLVIGLPATARPVTFEERVKTQEAIERVYYAHRIWPKENPQPKPPFEEMVLKAQIEAKVTDYLKKCVALDNYWRMPIKPEPMRTAGWGTEGMTEAAAALRTSP